VKTNLLLLPTPLRVGGAVFRLDDIRAGLKASIPAAVGAVAICVFGIVHYQVALADHSRALAELDAERATARYPLETQDTIKARAERVERVAHSLLSMRGAVVNGVAPLVLVTNIFPPNAPVRIKTLDVANGTVRVTDGEATSFEAALDIRERLRRARYAATIDTTTHSDHSPWTWTGTVTPL
jgi:hypothetical protein